MNEFKVGDRVRFRPAAVAGAHRQGQVGTVIAIADPPAQGGPVVDIRFDRDQIERGIRVHQLEHA
jgi:hypothetical protein